MRLVASRLARLAAPLTVAGLLLAGCASMDAGTQQHQVASLLGYLFPDNAKPPADPAPEQVAVLHVPLRVGVAFVPSKTPPTAAMGLPETERQRLASLVSKAFASQPFVASIETVPSTYLEPGGGFANLEKVAALLRLDVVALISYDQMQFAGANKWSFLYWTGVGAYVVEGDQYDVLTALETAVFDVRSRRLLMRASGNGVVKGESSWVGFAERSREARAASFDSATRQMVDNLSQEVAHFRERAPKDPTIRLELPPGYNPAAKP